jgi:hypothetical protein
VNPDACGHGVQNFFVVPHRRRVPAPDPAPRPEVSGADTWRAAATHIGLWISWHEKDYLALDRESTEAWHDPGLLETHLIGACRFISLIMQYYTIRITGGRGAAEAYALFSEELRTASSDGVNRFVTAHAILDMLGSDGGLLHTQQPRAIGQVSDLLRELLTAEAVLLEFACAATAEPPGRAAIRLQAIARFEGEAAAQDVGSTSGGQTGP